MDGDGFDLINTINNDVSRRSNFRKKFDLITKISFYINKIKAQNSKCARQQRMRERRQIDVVLLRGLDFGLKNMREETINEKLDELAHLNTTDGKCSLSH